MVLPDEAKRNEKKKKKRTKKIKIKIKRKEHKHYLISRGQSSNGDSVRQRAAMRSAVCACHGACLCACVPRQRARER